MRSIYLSLLLALSFPMLAQWQGDTDQYEIFPDSLQLNAPSDAGGVAHLSQPSAIIEDASWEVNVKLAFNPSSSNFANVYLVSDKNDFSGNGYYVKIGGTNDEVSLFRQDGNNHTKIIDGVDDRVDVNSVNVRIRVTRQNGLWNLYTDLAETAYIKEGEVSDETYLMSSYFGVQSNYTKSRSNDFSFAQFSITGTAFVDDVAPRLEAIECVTKYKAILYFNEEVKVNTITYKDASPTSLEIDAYNVSVSYDIPFQDNDSNLFHIEVEDTSSNALNLDTNAYYKTYEVLFAYMQSSSILVVKFGKQTDQVLVDNITLNGFHPTSILKTNTTWTATLATPIPSRTIVHLIVENTLDVNGDTLQRFSSEVSYYVAEKKDLVINELMPDPSPSLGTLPEVEYMELYNTTDIDISLTNWHLVRNNLVSYDVPDVIIKAKGYLLLGGEAAMDSFPDIENKASMYSFPSLVNGGMTLQLISNDSLTVDFLTYNSSWHADHAEDGGYALSRIDPLGESTVTNFQSSCSPHGGTPGSVNCDEPPVLVSAEILTKYTAIFHFNEGVSVNDVNSSGQQAVNTLVEANSVEATFANAFMEKDSNLLSIGVQDANGNGLLRDVKLYYSPFEVLSTKMLDPLHLSIEFSKPAGALDSTQVVLDSQNPSSFSLVAGTYIASFSTPIETRKSLSLEIKNILDANGDSLKYYSDDISFFIPELSDIVFNELMPDPSPVIGDLPEEEYIEMFNTSDFSIDIGGWFIKKNDKSYYLPTYRLAAKDYVVLTSTAALELFSDSINKVAMSSFPSLNNSGLSLQLLSSEAELIDSLSYSSSWHTAEAKDGGYALSRIDPLGKSTVYNFQSSCSPNGGTPGMMNCDKAPTLVSAEILTRYKAIFHFDENVTTNAISYDGELALHAQTSSNSIEATFYNAFVEKDSNLFSVDVKDMNGNTLHRDIKLFYTPFEVISTKMEDANHLSIMFSKVPSLPDVSQISLDMQHPISVYLDSGEYIASFLTAVENRQSVFVDIKDVMDINGDTLKHYSDEISFFLPELGDVVFNELMPDPSPVIDNLPEEEYIELFNTSEFSMNIGEWHIRKEDKRYPLPTYQLTSKDYVILTTASALNLFPDSINRVAMASFPSLSNSGMGLQLVGSKGELVDFVDYDNDWHEDSFKSAGGFSLERIDVENPLQLNNWTSSCSVNGGTPGFANCVAGDNPDYDPPYVVNAYALNNKSVIIEFSEPILSSELQDMSYYSFSDGQSIKSAAPLGEISVSQELVLTLTDALEDAIVYELTVSDISDLSGNILEMSSHVIAICDLPDRSEIVINEIMFAPFSGEAEYIEIYNTTTVPFDLSKLKVTKQEADGSWELGRSVSEMPYILLPNSYLALSADVEILTSQYSIEDNAVMSIVSMPSLGNEGGNIALILSNAEVVDVLRYSDDWHSPLLNDTRGVALERLCSEVSTNEPSNWFSASSLVNYGTPGAENSQKATVTVNEDNEINTTPEVFTPDGDGIDDFTTIKFDEKYEGSTVRIQVFNHRGLVVKELSNNTLIGSYSNVRWDGSDQNGARCPMGAYIIRIEIITSQGNVVVEKLESVISARFR